MESNDRPRVSEVIEAHTERVPIQALFDRGSTHVRVISGQKALELIQAVVDETIARRASALAGVERDRVIRESNEQFQRVSRIQAEAEALAVQQREHIAGQGERIRELESRLKRAAESLRRREHRLANARQTIESYDAEISRLVGQVKSDAELLGQLRAALKERTDEVVRLRDTQGGGLDGLRAELGALRELLEKGGNGRVSELEERFEASLRRTLDGVSRTIRAATEAPLDRPIEATDALVSRLFDRENEMESNLSRLDVEVSTAQAGIAESLARLKRLRGDDRGDEEAGEAPAAPG